MRFTTLLRCSKCRQPIVHGEGFGFGFGFGFEFGFEFGFGFVSFKIPGKEGYYFFHYRVRARDCWETYLKEGM